jgi:type I restriction enzyme S subunit
MINIGRGSIINCDKLERIEDSVEVAPRDHLKHGDLLLNTRNSLDLVGKVALWRSETQGAAFNNNLMRIEFKPSAGLLNEYANLWFNSYDGIRQLRRIAIGTTSVAAIYWRDLASLMICIPPQHEQRKIADILTTWDEALTQLDALIEAQERRKKALMQQLLRGRRRLMGFSKPWMKAKLGTLFKERIEQGRGDLPLLSITADRGIVPREDVAKRDSSSEDKSKYLRIVPGDIGYNTMRMWQGVSALSALEGIVSPAYTICKPTDQIDGRFAAHFLKFHHTVHLFHRYSQGLVDDTLNLKFPSFAVIEVSIPRDLEEQRQIATILDTADQQLTLLRTQSTALDQQKRGLMQRLLTGKLRVKTHQQTS